MLPRLALSLAPVLVALAFAFALFHVYAAALAVRAQNWPFAAFYLLLGVAGLALSLGLLRTYRRVRSGVRQRHD